MKNLPKKRHADIVVQSLDKELLVYDLLTHRAYQLNETSIRGGNGTSSVTGCRAGCFCRSASTDTVANGTCG